MKHRKWQRLLSLLAALAVVVAGSEVQSKSKKPTTCNYTVCFNIFSPYAGWNQTGGCRVLASNGTMEITITATDGSYSCRSTPSWASTGLNCSNDGPYRTCMTCQSPYANMIYFVKLCGSWYDCGNYYCFNKCITYKGQVRTTCGKTVETYVRPSHN